MTSEWTEGVCDDGAAILRDGRPVTIPEILQCLNNGEVARLEALEEAARIADKLTGLIDDAISVEMAMAGEVVARRIAAAIRERAKTLP